MGKSKCLTCIGSLCNFFLSFTFSTLVFLLACASNKDGVITLREKNQPTYTIKKSGEVSYQVPQLHQILVVHQVSEREQLLSLWQVFLHQLKVVPSNFLGVEGDRYGLQECLRIVR